MSTELNHAPAPLSPDSDQLDPAEVLAAARAIRKRLCDSWRRFLLAWVFAGALALLYFFGRTPEYSASTRILPYKPAGGELQTLGNLASLASGGLHFGGSEQVVSADLYPEVAGSLNFRAELIRVPLHFRDGVHTFDEYFSRIYAPRFLDAPLRDASADDREGDSPPIAQNLTPHLSASDSVLPLRFPRSFLKRLDNLKHRVQTDMDRRTSIITITATMPDPVAAADLVNAVARRLTREIVAYESQKASELAKSLQEQQARAESRYKAAQMAMAQFRDRNRAVSVYGQQEAQRLSLEEDLATELYKNLSMQLELARVKQQETTPVLAVLEAAVVPERRESPRLGIALVVALTVATAIVFGQVLVSYWLDQRRSGRVPVSLG